jgi:hypothetical protein
MRSKKPAGWSSRTRSICPLPARSRNWCFPPPAILGLSASVCTGAKEAGKSEQETISCSLFDHSPPATKRLSPRCNSALAVTDVVSAQESAAVGRASIPEVTRMIRVVGPSVAQVFPSPIQTVVVPLLLGATERVSAIPVGIALVVVRAVIGVRITEITGAAVVVVRIAEAESEGPAAEPISVMVVSIATPAPVKGATAVPVPSARIAAAEPAKVLATSALPALTASTRLRTLTAAKGATTTAAPERATSAARLGMLTAAKAASVLASAALSLHRGTPTQSTYKCEDERQSHYRDSSLMQIFFHIANSLFFEADL